MCLTSLASPIIIIGFSARSAEHLLSEENNNDELSVYNPAMARGQSLETDSILYGQLRSTEDVIDQYGRDKRTGEVDITLPAFADEHYFDQFATGFVGNERWLFKANQLPIEWKNRDLSAKQAYAADAISTMVAQLESGSSVWHIDNPDSYRECSFQFEESERSAEDGQSMVPLTIPGVEEQGLKVLGREVLAIEQLTGSKGQWLYFGPPLIKDLQPMVVYYDDGRASSSYSILGASKCSINDNALY